jgi:hypothetical protein
MGIYVPDANARVELERHFPDQLRKLRHMVQQGQIKIPDRIFRELRRKTDHLCKEIDQWAKRNSNCIVRISHVRNLADELARIERGYGQQVVVGAKSFPGFWQSPAGQKAADGQVIAVAKVLNATIVSEDRAVRLVGMLENVPCIGWTEFARRATLSTRPRLPGID